MERTDIEVVDTCMITASSVDRTPTPTEHSMTAAME
jgi:hypothetical protein